MSKRIEIDDAVLAKVEAQCPKYLSHQGFANLVLDQALDRGVTLGVQSEAGTPSTSKPLLSTSKKRLSTYIDIGDLVSEELSFCKDDLIAWWALRKRQHGKQAVGTEQAWTTSQNALLVILRTHGQKVVQDTVTAALANGWRGIRESYAVLPRAVGNNPAQPEFKHPASKVFTAKDFA